MASGSLASARAARATAWVTWDRWYGSRTSSSACGTAGSAARYPTRAPASAKAFDMVRVTTSRRQRGSRVSAVAEVSRANSAYASSTMTMPGAAAQTASITRGASAVPVGLFGEVRKTRSGWQSRMAARA